MKKVLLSLFLLPLVWVGLSAQTPEAEPTVNLQRTNVTATEILSEITAQTGLHFSYNSRRIDVQRRISVDFVNSRLSDALQELSTQLDVDFRIVENQIVLYISPERQQQQEQSFTLSGFITDGASGENLIGATVSKTGTRIGTVSNAFGFYSLPLKRGQHKLDYSYVGYEQKDLSVKLPGVQKQDLSLQPTSIDLPDVIVEKQASKPLAQQDLDEMEIVPSELSAMPEFAGESGIVKGLQTLPGISMHSDGSAFFYTRGGERDQNLIIIDDAPLYNPFHLFGFYSMIIPDFAKQIKVYKSDIPANLGDRLSSIVSIRTKDGNLNKFEFSGAINPLVNRFAIEAPLVKEKGAIFFSMRGSNFDWLYRQRAPNANLEFRDFSLKLNHKINNRNRIYFTAILGYDDFTNRPPGGTVAGIRWGNFASTLRWNHIFGPKLFSNTTIYTGSYDYRLFSPPNSWRSSLGTLSLKSDFTHYANARLTARFGLESQGYFINPGSVTTDTTVAILPTIESNYTRKLSLYYQAQWKANEKLSLKAGLRLINWANIGPTRIFDYDDNYEVSDTMDVGEGVYNNYVRFSPRFSFLYQPDSSTRYKLSFGVYQQFLQLISNSLSPFSSLEIWLPANHYLKPQSVRQISLNYGRLLSAKKQISFNASLYYKHFDQQIDYKDHAITLLNPLLEGELRMGTMYSYGAEFMLKKPAGRLNGWMSYTYSRTFRRTPALNQGREYPAFQDRPHDFSVLLNYRLARRTLFSAYWTSFSGTTFSSPTGFYQFNDQTVPIFAEKNNDRLPTYHRLDVAWRFILNKNPKARYQHSLTFSIYNALAHKNVVHVNFNKIPVEGARPLVKTNLLSTEALRATQVDLIRFMPSLTYKFKI